MISFIHMGESSSDREKLNLDKVPPEDNLYIAGSRDEWRSIRSLYDMLIKL